MMAVSPSSFFAFLLVVAHLVILDFAAASEKYQRNCPDSFDSCGNPTTGKIKFPFTDDTYPGCGLCAVNCSGEGGPRIRLVGQEEWHKFKEIRERDKIIIIPKNNLRKLSSSRSCKLFNNLVPLPSTPSISFNTIYPSLTPHPITTLFKCSSSIDELGQHVADTFHLNYYSHQDCPGFTVYYRDSTSIEIPPIGPPNGCTAIQLPVLRSTTDEPNAGDVFSILDIEDVDFSIRWDVSEQCGKCRNDSGQCSEDPQGFHCLKDGNRWKLILGIAIPGGVILLLCLFVLAFRIRRKGAHQFWYSRNTTADPSSRTTDLEGSSIFFGIPIFSYSELEAATNNFDPSKELGDGGFGIVYHGKLRDGREVAVKRLFERNYKQVLTQFTNEIEILTCLRHPNLVSLYGCTSRHCRELLLVYEYIPNGTVADHLYGDRAKDGSLTWPIRMNIAIQTASALTYLHASEIIHRDVKTNNILLDNNFNVKVADFGLSRLFPSNVTHVSTAPQGTPGYVDPEYHQCYQLTTKSDVYSFGVVLVELISSMPAVDITRHGNEINLAKLAINRIQNGAFDELIDPSIGFRSDSSIETMATSVAEVAFRCLQLESEMRPTMDEVLETLKEIHNYGKETDDKVGVVLGKDDDHKVKMPNNSLDSVNLDGLVSLPNLPRHFPVVKPSFRSV